LPYHNYPSSVVVSHAHPEPATHVPVSKWTGPRGYGGRHWLDIAPFSLWDLEKNDFRLPTALEVSWLITHYNPTAIDFQFPIMVIETVSPPKPLPLTVAAVAVNFVPPPTKPVHDINGLRMKPLFNARPGVATNYAGPREPVDPLSFKFRKWTQPSDEELRVLVEQLFTFCNPRMVHILCPQLIVELHVDDQRVYKPNSLPRRIGGFAVYYYHQADSVFGGLSIRGRETTYFEAKGPHRLLRSQEIPLGAFFCVDGMSTGAVFMQAQGISLDIPSRPPFMTAIPFPKWEIFRGFGALGSVPRQGICGVALVEDDSDQGGVAGFIEYGNEYFALTPSLDEFIDRSWNVV
jgi:hypothetical protein